jgi:hypothetical protein
MERFEYEITTHAAENFRKLVYFCSEQGACGMREVPAGEPQILVDLLNERGLLGWELIQLSFGGDGIMAYWKRKRMIENV